MVNERYQHQPVFLEEVIRALAIKKEGIYIDATLGRGGHSKAILEKLGLEGRLIAIDRDPEAVAITKKFLGEDDRVEVIHGSFSQLKKIAKEKDLIEKVDGILFDLGVSSPQLDDPKRGFSFLQEGPLDMRMDNSQGMTAAEWLAIAKESEISKVLHDFGEERFSRRIARSIVSEREIEPITTTTRLAEIVSKANLRWEKGKHPATRAFQAIRIFINQELNELQSSLTQALDILAIGGRLVVISFHSLEDRIVKHFIRQHSQRAKIPAEIPIVFTEERFKLKDLSRNIKPTADEIATNPRSRSAVLRIAEKLT